MAFFANGSPTQVTASVGTAATLVFDTDASGIATGASLPDVAVTNTGTVTMFVGGSSVGTASGLRCVAGATILQQGQSALQSSTVGDVYACTATGTTTALAGLMSLDPII